MAFVTPVVAAGAGLLMNIGAGCFSPTIVENTADTVVLKFGQWESPDELIAKADALCRFHGKAAQLNQITPDADQENSGYVTYDCVVPGA